MNDESKHAGCRMPPRIAEIRARRKILSPGVCAAVQEHHGNRGRRRGRGGWWAAASERDNNSKWGRGEPRVDSTIRRSCLVTSVGCKKEPHVGHRVRAARRVLYSPLYQFFFSILTANSLVKLQPTTGDTRKAPSISRQITFCFWWNNDIFCNL